MKLQERLETELSTTIRFQKGEAVGVTIYGIDRATKQIEKDILELIGEDDNEEKNSFYGVETANTRNGLRAELRLKLKEYCITQKL
jgi:hypothetical protein